MPRKRRGFTLVELAVTLGVLSIVAAAIVFALPLRDISRREALAAAEQLMADIRYARQRAILSGRRVEIRFNEARDSFTIYYLTPLSPIRTVHVPEGVTVLLPQGSVNLAFTPRGTPVRGGFSAILRTSRHDVTVSVVGSGGRVRISSFLEVDRNGEPGA